MPAALLKLLRIVYGHWLRKCLTVTVPHVGYAVERCHALAGIALGPVLECSARRAVYRYPARSQVARPPP